MTQPSQPNEKFEKFSQQLKNHITTAFAMGVDAAKDADKENFGIDQRLKVWHRFVDLEVKGHAEMIETVISGPWINPAPYEVFDIILVDPVDYEREVCLENNFIRVGFPKNVTLPRTKMTAVPKIIPKGVNQFKLYLTDLSYIGANYRGVITLKPVPAAVASGLAAADPITKVYSAGL